MAQVEAAMVAAAEVGMVAAVAAATALEAAGLEEEALVRMQLCCKGRGAGSTRLTACCLFQRALLCLVKQLPCRGVERAGVHGVAAWTSDLFEDERSPVPGERRINSMPISER